MPVDPAPLGKTALSTQPIIEQIFVKRSADIKDLDTFERKLYVIRKYAERSIERSALKQAAYFYPVSLSCKTIVYKGMLTPNQLKPYFLDLQDKRLESAFALVHSRFSTNTFPAWSLAQPFRYLCHNGEINTLRGNMNWMKAREAIFESDVFSKEDLAKIKPVITEEQSDSACIDNVIELLSLAGRSLAHGMMMLIPEAWSKDQEIDPHKKSFYEYHAALMEPWDGPASIAFTDGEVIGATLDRNGLRPSRWVLTKDDFLVLASEAGVIDFAAETIVAKGRLQPGKMLLADLRAGRIITDDELKEKICRQRPYKAWVEKGKFHLSKLAQPSDIQNPVRGSIRQKQQQFGYSLEDLRFILAPMAETGKEPIGSMGSDTPPAVLSNKAQNIYNYFRQLFAQVTNPPIDPIREESVMSLTSFVGEQKNLLAETPEHFHVIELPQPVLLNEELERLRWVDEPGFQAKTIPITFRVDSQSARLKEALEHVRQNALKAVEDGSNIIVLSDRPADSAHAPIPSLLAVSAVHHHLIRKGKRAQCAIIIETGEAREVHHFALLLGFGASAINPYLAINSIDDMIKRGLVSKSLKREEAVDRYIRALDKGLLKILSKMGISTIQSYIGAQIFECLGINEDTVKEYFPGTVSRIQGVGLDVIEKECILRHRHAFGEEAFESRELEPGGQYQWRQRGEIHLHSPMVIHKLQNAARTDDYEEYKIFSSLIDKQDRQFLTLRGLLEFTNLTPIALDEVEAAENIYRRFSTGAMSFGSISWEAHTTLAIAMNRIGGKSNTGEGGEDPLRFKPMENGDSMRSSIKQVASGRFGVTSNYLANSDEIQIKIAQGAKPGEGGQLPGHKVDKTIGRVRHSTPGVELISPPPHHDIYSIEDLAQLIYDLKNSNDRARINVKLVSEVGVGTIAAGVSKAHADVVLISGAAGGTGASPLSSIKHAGLPWELGLAETHQTLIKNRLRDRIVVQTDGMIRTGRDLAIAALLGAEEWGVATGSLIVSGCIMMRKCHLNTCPVGIATQDKDLRKLFTGNPHHVVNYFKFMVQELREIMASLGFKTVDAMVGRTDKLAQRKDIPHWKASGIDLSPLLHKVETGEGDHAHCCRTQDHGLDKKINYALVEKARVALERKKKIEMDLEIKNINRTLATILSSEISRKHGEEGLPKDTIKIHARGSAGQSFMAFGVHGITVDLQGEANDYFGKGLSGGTLILRPPVNSTYEATANVIVGNVAFYGATRGEAYIRGMAGERFCVRNSGVEVVVSSVGDHGCEYMTGGRVIILGAIGKNFAAGMSGGIAYLYDQNGLTCSRINRESVDLEVLEDPQEIDYVKTKISNYIELTDAKEAKPLILEWEKIRSKIIKVMPRSYKQALAKLAEEEKRADSSPAKR